MTAILYRVGDIADQIRGVTYNKQDASPRKQDGYLPVLRAGNITEFGLAYEDLVYVPSSKISPKQMVRENDIVIAASSGSIEVVGKAARALEDFEGGFGAFCKVLRPSEKVNSAYFSHFFKTPEYRREISSLAAGANINNLRNRDLDNLQIPIPPLDEQKRIAAILDEADAMRAKCREALAQLDALLQSTFMSMFGDPVINPMGWETQTLGEVIKVRSGNGLTAKKKAPDGTFPVYGGNGINGYHDQYMFEDPTIILGRVGVYCGVVHLTKPKSWITDNALYVRELLHPIETLYLVEALKVANLNQYASQAAQPLISGGRIYPVRISLPPLDLQRRFAAIVESVEQQKARMRAHLTELDALFASLQHRAFNGEL